MLTSRDVVDLRDISIFDTEQASSSYSFNQLTPSFASQSPLHIEQYILIVSAKGQDGPTSQHEVDFAAKQRRMPISRIVADA